MRVLVCGSTGCVGRAVSRALRSRGHVVIDGARGAVDGRHALQVDFMASVPPALWAHRLAERHVDAVVNCVGILMARRGQSFERVHTDGPIELFRGAVAAGVRRVVQISALGVGGDAASVAMPYLHSKLLADEALAALDVDGAVVRPALLYGPGSQSAALFATLASLPVVSLPGFGRHRLQPLHVYELGEAIVRLVEAPQPVRGVHELGGGDVLSYREMLAHYRDAMGLAAPVWLPVPPVVMALGARVAEHLPQQVFCRDTLRLLDRGLTPATNATARLLGRAPSSLAHGLATTAPTPFVDLRVTLSPAVTWLLRVAIAFMWFAGAAIALVSREASVALVAGSALHVALGLAMVLRPSGRVHALQVAAVVAGIATGTPLATSLPVLAVLVTLWLARRGTKTPQPARLLDKGARAANT